MQFWGGENCMRFSEKNYPLNGFTTQRPWQLDNNNNIILLYAYVKFVVHVVQSLLNRCSVVVQWLFTLLCFPIYCDVC